MPLRVREKVFEKFFSEVATVCRIISSNMQMSNQGACAMAQLIE